MAIDRRKFLAGTTAAAALAVSTHARAQGNAQPKPRVTFISQWSAGSDGAAISGSASASRRRAAYGSTVRCRASPPR